MDVDHYKKTFPLSDGTIVTIRPILKKDAQIEWDFVHRLSSEARYFRFFNSVKDLTTKMLDFFVNIDHKHHMALIATILDENSLEFEIGVARYYSDPDLKNCEFAIVVEDDWQHHGIGAALMSSLIEWAKASGLETMSGEVMAHNSKMLEFLEEQNFTISPHKKDASLVSVLKRL